MQANFMFLTPDSIHIEQELSPLLRIKRAAHLDTCLGADVDDLLDMVPKVIILLLLQPPRHVLPELARLLKHPQKNVRHQNSNRRSARSSSLRSDAAGGRGARG